MKVRLEEKSNNSVICDDFCELYLYIEDKKIGEVYLCFDSKNLLGVLIYSKYKEIYNQILNENYKYIKLNELYIISIKKINESKGVLLTSSNYEFIYHSDDGSPTKVLEGKLIFDYRNNNIKFMEKKVTKFG